jgi:hypothetical protein
MTYIFHFFQSLCFVARSFPTRSHDYAIISLSAVWPGLAIRHGELEVGSSL